MKWQRFSWWPCMNTHHCFISVWFLCVSLSPRPWCSAGKWYVATLANPLFVVAATYSTTRYFNMLALYRCVELGRLRLTVLFFVANINDLASGQHHHPESDHLIRQHHKFICQLLSETHMTDDKIEMYNYKK